MTVPQLLWEWGTAYDLFMSLEVLHNPADFGVRGAWAAGVRARLPSAEREILEESQSLFFVPLPWIHSLPDPKDALTVLWALGQIPPAERLPLLTYHPERSSEVDRVLGEVSAHGTWDEGDRAALRAAYQCSEEKKTPSAKELASILGWWARAEEFGERYLEALHAYQEVFFAEEENRIRPALQDALTRAQELAGRMELPRLLEELSQGLRFAELPDVAEWVLVPSYWSTPLVLFDKVSAERLIWVFGARPANASLVPGEAVPDSMLRGLKALSDPTRLRILHYLAQEPLTPAELSRRLRLRAPTVTHHLKLLRLAGLVQLTLGEDKEERRYAARSDAIDATFASLEDFLKPDDVTGTAETN
jgi:DNA-binding transcriptional ArsR family regulator